MSHNKKKIETRGEYYTLSHQPVNESEVHTLLAPVMIVGSPRSGTTWLQKLLLENDAICGGQESHFYSIFYAAFLSVMDDKDVRKVGLSAYWEIEDFNQQMRELWIRTFLPMLNNKPEATVLLEKTPFHALYVDKIFEFLPDAKFIHIIRDSRSVTASLNAASKGWGGYWAPGNTKASALEWYRHVKAVRSSNVVQNKDIYLEVHYEDLLNDTVGEISRILSFIGLPTDEKEIQFGVESQTFEKQKNKGGTGLKNSKGEEVKEPEGFFRKGLVDSWKKDLSFYQKLVTWRFTRKLMRECGYDWRGKK